MARVLTSLDIDVAYLTEARLVNSGKDVLLKATRFSTRATPCPLRSSAIVASA